CRKDWLSPKRCMSPPVHPGTVIFRFTF
ncbi:uncharacterized protein METZ01_LOCUS234749, partial [marine metagenome]